MFLVIDLVYYNNIGIEKNISVHFQISCFLRIELGGERESNIKTIDSPFSVGILDIVYCGTQRHTLS